jgi:hypothetical protein
MADSPRASGAGGREGTGLKAEVRGVHEDRHLTRADGGHRVHDARVVGLDLHRVAAHEGAVEGDGDGAPHLLAAGDRRAGVRAGLAAGLGLVAALHDRSPTLYRIR